MVPLGAVMGHECSGVVAEVGKDVRDFRPGDRVVAKPIAQCGECAPCKRGAYSLCVSAFDRAIGITTTNDGAFAEYVKIEHPREMLFRLPDNVSFEQGALVEPLSTSLHAVRLSRVRPGDSVVVIGAGMIGLGTIQFLKLAGAGRIIALEISEAKAGLALKAGADIVLDPLKEGEGLQAHILDLTDGVGAEVVYECSGVPFGFQNAMYFAKSGGQVMIVGIVDKEVAFTPFRMVLTEIEMKAVLGYYDEFDYVIRFLSQGRLNTDILISGIVPLSDVEKGFDRLLSSRDDVKILVRP
jgi:(R,R)-butanediol dehydrogenase/meso-butanediol dehydrogenase/diacetyl reductase